jgi:hypothetical protein
MSSDLTVGVISCETVAVGKDVNTEAKESTVLEP